MGILAFLVVFYCLVLVAWVFGFFNPSTAEYYLNPAIEKLEIKKQQIEQFVAEI